MPAPTATANGSEWTPAASSAKPAQAPTTTLLTTATIPAAVSVSCQALGARLASSDAAELGPRTTTRYGPSSGASRR